MEIGPEGPPFVIEPIDDPVPAAVPEPERQEPQRQEPQRRPQPTPERVPEPVPGR